MSYFMTKTIHSSWLPLIDEALKVLDAKYLQTLKEDSTWLPGPDKIFNAFTRPVSSLAYILFGESPYPRKESANGCAFWDAAVGGLWTMEGLEKAVNRATSLRNIIKMLLVADGALKSNHTSQSAIAQLNKSHYVTNMVELFNNIQDKGILLLNASLVFRKNYVRQDAAAWLPFMDSLLGQIKELRPTTQLILLGKIAQLIAGLPNSKHFKQFYAEHPYNISFISNPNVLNFFKPLKLLHRKTK